MSLNEKFDTSTAAGRLVFHLFAALMQFAKEMIRERTRAGCRRHGREADGWPKELLTAQQVKVLQDL